MIARTFIVKSIYQREQQSSTDELRREMSVETLTRYKSVAGSPRKKNSSPREPSRARITHGLRKPDC